MVADKCDWKGIEIVHPKDYGFGRYAAKLKLEAEKPIPGKELGKVLSAFLESVAKECVKKKAVIGHLKAFVETPKGSLKASLVDLKLGVEVTGEISGTVKKGDLVFDIIVHGIADSKVEELTKARMDLLSKKGFSYSLVMEEHKGEEHGDECDHEHGEEDECEDSGVEEECGDECECGDTYGEYEDSEGACRCEDEECETFED